MMSQNDKTELLKVTDNRINETLNMVTLLCTIETCCTSVIEYSQTL